MIILFNSNLSADIYNSQDITIQYPTEQVKLAKLIVDNLAEDSDKFYRKTGQYPDLKTQIIMAEDNEHYLAIIGKHSPILEFSQACYIPRISTILIKNPYDLKNFNKLRQIVLHEFIHHFVYHQIKNPPLWFNEGMAVYFSNDLSYQREMNFIKNYLMGNSQTLVQMKHRYPENRLEWESFYAKSALAVKYLAKHKPKRFFHFWEALQKNPEFSAAFLSSFFFTPTQFSRFFEQYSKQHFRLELLLASSSLIWAIFPLLFIIGILRRKWRDKKTMKNWQNDEIIHNEIEKEKSEI